MEWQLGFLLSLSAIRAQDEKSDDEAEAQEN